MENTEQNKPDNNILEPKRARAWIITLALSIAVCLGAIAYNLITHNPAVSFLDSSLFKSGLVWLGCIGLILSFISFLLFWISDSIVRFLPDKKPLDNMAAISGIFFLLLSFSILFVSYDLETQQSRYLGYVAEMTGASLSTGQKID